MFSQGTVYTNQGIEQWVLYQETFEIPTWRGWQIKKVIEDRNRRVLVHMDTHRNGTNAGFTISLNGTSEDVSTAKVCLEWSAKYHSDRADSLREHQHQKTQIARVRNATMCSMVNWK